MFACGLTLKRMEINIIYVVMKLYAVSLSIVCVAEFKTIWLTDRY